MVVGFYCIPFLYLIKYAKFRFQPLEIVGRASYHIFLVQMVLYRNICISYIYEIITKRYHQLFVILGISIILGVLFYFVECIFKHALLLKMKLNS